MRTLPFLFLTLAAIIVIGFPGCGSRSGPPLAIVTGKVTMSDEPLSGVKVVFVPQGKGSPSYGATDENGEFSLKFNQNRSGAELGTHDVLIEAPQPETDDSGKIIDPSSIVKIPKKYQQPGVLTAEVVSGRNELEFDLDAKD